jgi:hypothetical protein
LFGSLYLLPSLLLQVQLLAALEQQEPASLTKVLLFYARLGPEHADLFQEVRWQQCLGSTAPLSGGKHCSGNNL